MSLTAHKKKKKVSGGKTAPSAKSPASGAAGNATVEERARIVNV